MVTTFSWRQPRSWSLLLLCLLLTGCATRVIYYWLDSAIVWQLDDYFSLDRSQKKLLDQEVKGLMAWHRQHELPIYARDLDALAKAAVARKDGSLVLGRQALRDALYATAGYPGIGGSLRSFPIAAAHARPPTMLTAQRTDRSAGSNTLASA